MTFADVFNALEEAEFLSNDPETVEEEIQKAREELRTLKGHYAARLQGLEQDLQRVKEEVVKLTKEIEE